jgi:Bacterial Ig-like domain (group 2)
MPEEDREMTSTTKWRPLSRLALAAGLLAAATACGSKSPTAPSGGGGGAAATLSSVGVTGDTSVTMGLTEQLKATANKSDGSQADVTGQAAWVSSDPAIATVSTAGVLSAVKTGNITVTATYQGKSGSIQVSVRAKSFTLRVTLNSMTILGTCDDFTQSLADGEFAVKFTSADSSGSVHTLYETQGYPGDPNNLYTLKKDRLGDTTTFTDSYDYRLSGEVGQSVKVTFRATEWDSQIVLIPPSIRWIHDGKMNDKGTSRNHSYANGTFGNLGANTLTLGSGSCEIQAHYTVQDVG